MAQKIYLGGTQINRYYHDGNNVSPILDVPQLFTTGLQHQYDASNPGGSPSNTWTDLTGTKNGTYSPATGVTYVSTAPSYFDFSGISDNDISFTLPIPTFMSGTGTKTFTLIMWVKLDSVASTRTILNIGDSTTAGAQLAIKVLTTGQIRHEYGGIEARNTTQFISTGNWYQIAVVKDGSTVGDYYQYLNGQKVGKLPALTQTTNLATSTDHQFGNENGTEKLDGQVGEYLIYNRVLTDLEVGQNYLHFVPRFYI